jgi:protein YIPF5/7
MTDLQFFDTAYGERNPSLDGGRLNSGSHNNIGMSSVIGGGGGLSSSSSAANGNNSAANFMNEALGIEDAPPLLEELGIDFVEIKKQTLAVLMNPVRPITDKDVLDETDLAGPLLYGLLFGSVLLLSGKVHFGYVYGFGVLGSLGICALMNLMTESGIALYKTISVLGYCLLPMIMVAAVGILVPLNGMFGAVIAPAAVSWCAYSASSMFVRGLNMHDQLPLVLYPTGLLYACFALLAIF